MGILVTFKICQARHMLKISVISLLTLIVFSSSARNDVDKLKKEILTAGHDTTRLNLKFLIADQLQDSGSDSALFYFYEALSLANDLTKKLRPSDDEYRDITYLKAKTLKRIASCYYNKKYDHDSSSVYYAEAVKLIQYLADTEKNKSKKEKFLDILANTLITTGVVCFEEGDLAQSSEYYRQAIEISREINDSLTLSKGIVNQGMILNNQGKYDEAIKNYITAIKIFEQLHDQKGIAISHLSIGNILRKQNTQEKAIASYNNALKIFKEINDELGECFCYNNLGICYTNLGNYKKSFEFYNRALAIYEKNGNESGMSMMYSNISTVYLFQDDYDKATEYVLKSLKINEKNRNSLSLLGAYVNLASIYLERATDSLISVTPRREYIDNAIQYAEKGLALTDTLQLIMEKVSTLKVLKDAYSLKGNYEKAYEMANTMIELNDSLYNKEKTKIIADIETKYETDKKEHEIQKQKLEIYEQQLKLSNARLLRNSLAVAFVLLVIVILLVSRNYRQKNKAHRILDEKNSLIEKQNREILLQSNNLQAANKKLIDLLQFKEGMTGMIVHDLKNPLSNILNSNVIPDNEFREQLIMQSGYDMLNLVENILDVYKLQETGMRIEKEQVDIYEILKANLVEVALYITEKGLTIELPPKDIPSVMADKKLIKRIFSNFLSNAVKYSPDHSTITIQVKVINGRDVRISIYNPGPAIPKDKQNYIFENFGQYEPRTIGLPSSTGIGLSFCKKAVEAHNGKIGVISEKEGAEFWFILPDSFILEEQ